MGVNWKLNHSEKPYIDDFRLLVQHSNATESQIERALKSHFYGKPEEWNGFFSWFLLAIGVGMIGAGVVCFFAYNWEGLHKFVKLGMISFAMVVLASLILFTRWNELVKNILLMGLSLLVGVFFAVFGQIYQTGADAYDFFMGWTVFILLWVLSSNFAPHWAFFLLIFETTILLFFDQRLDFVESEWQYFTFVCINSIIFIATEVLKKWFKKDVPQWLSYLIFITAIGFCITLSFNICFDQWGENSWMIFVIPLLYVVGIIYGLQLRKVFYLVVISIAGMLLTIAVMAFADIDELIIYYSFFIVVLWTGVTISIIKRLLKTWNDDTSR